MKDGEQKGDHQVLSPGSITGMGKPVYGTVHGRRECRMLDVTGELMLGMLGVSVLWPDGEPKCFFPWRSVDGIVFHPAAERPASDPGCEN